MRRALALLLLASHACVVSHAQTRTSTSATATTPARAGSTQTDSVERAAAQYWGLPLEDYRRYQTLMKGVRGAISDPRISPIEVLGIHARDAAERRKYAEMFARLMAEDTQRVLQFQREYDQAFKRQHPRLVALDLAPGTRPPATSQAALTTLAPQSPVTGMSRAPSVAAGDRVLVFTREGCGDCDDLVRRVVPLVRHGAVVDLYVVGAGSGDDVRRYARRIALDPALVNDRSITLNVDAGVFSRVLPQQRQLPALVRKRGESVMQLALSDL